MKSTAFYGLRVAYLAAAVLSPLAQAATPAPAEPNGACTGFYADGATLVTGQVVKPWAKTVKPSRGATVKEASYGTCQVRVTDHTADSVKGFARNDYSRRQAFNSDSTRQIVYAYDGHWHLYDAVTYQHLAVLPDAVAGDAEPQWHPSKPNYLFYLPTNGVGMKVYRLDTNTMQSIVVGDLSARLKAKWPTANAAWTKSEGSPSADSRYWCFMVDSSAWGGLGLVTWDKKTDTILGMIDLPERPDHVSMSPSGNYCVASSYGGPGVVAYSRDLKTSRKIANIGEHSDIGIDANGDDAYVSIDYQDNNGSVFMVNLRTGVRTNILATYLNGTSSAFHFSAKAFRKTGWFVMSTYAESGSQQWLHRKVSVIQMSASPKIYDLADTRVNYNGYWTEPQASVNRDLTRVVWTSNWDVSTDMDVDTYSVQLKSSMIQ